jgi:hypothetical protein
VEVEASFAKERSGGSCWNLSIPFKCGKRKMDYDSSYSTGGCERNLNFLEKEIRISANPIIGGGIKLRAENLRAMNDQPARVKNGDAQMASLPRLSTPPPG